MNNSMHLIGLNVKWYRYNKNLTQEELSGLTGLKMSYISTIETGYANLTCKNIDLLARTLKVSPSALFNEETAKKALRLPKRVDVYKGKR